MKKQQLKTVLQRACEKGYIKEYMLTERGVIDPEYPERRYAVCQVLEEVIQCEITNQTIYLICTPDGFRGIVIKTK